jgi:RNA polymerase sigma-70 factor (ECF subfamily)
MKPSTLSVSVMEHGVMKPVASAVPVMERWVEAHALALFRYALLRLRHRSDAEDAAQETLLAAVSGSSPFRGDATERTWLIGILRHKIVDRLRLRGRDVQIQADDPSWWDALGRWKQSPGTWGDDPQALCEIDELRAVVRGCISSLPSRQAQAVALRSIDEMEFSQVASSLGISEGHVAVLLHRARAQLRDCLERRWFGIAR